MTIQLQKIKKGFKVGNEYKILFEDLSIKLPCVGLVAIVGSSGSGKSTLLHIIAGLTKVDEGSIEYNYKQLKYKNDFYIKQHISHLYQHYNLLDHLTVKENIIYGCFCKQHKIQQYEQMFQLAKKLEIDYLFDQYPNTLSGGQKQRVAFLRAFLCDMPILLCDEPTGSLHKQQSIVVMEMLKKYAKNHLVVIVSHDRPLVMNYTKHVILLDEQIKEYNFESKKYPVYFKKKETYEYNKEKILFSFKQLYKQKKTLFSLWIFEVLMISIFMIILAGCIGMNDYFLQLQEKEVSKNLIVVQKNDYLNGLINEDDLNVLSSYGEVYSYYGLEMGTINEESIHYSLLPTDLSHINYMDGFYSNKQNEICINESLYNKGYKLNDTLEYHLNNKVYHFKITGIIDDSLLQQDIIYYRIMSLEDEIKKVTHIDYMKLVEVEQSVELIINEMNEQGFYGFSYNIEMIHSLQSMVNGVMVIASVFIAISFLLSVILMNIVFTTLLEQRRKSIATSLSYGMDYKMLYQHYFIEGLLVGVVLGGSSFFIGSFLVSLFNLFGVYHFIFPINNLLKLNYSSTFLLLIFIYPLLCGFVAKDVAKQIGKMDIVGLLKEE